MFNLRIVKEYLKHRLKAKTRHGLHSPFVYRLVDKVVYDFAEKKVFAEIETLPVASKQRPRVKKLNRLLYRIIADYHPNAVLVPGKISPVTGLYIKAAADIGNEIVTASATVKAVLIDTENDSEARNVFNNCLNFVDEETLIIVKNMYCTDGMKAVWQEIKANPKVTVTVDLFRAGLVYFRKGQVREDFWIRF